MQAATESNAAHRPRTIVLEDLNVAGNVKEEMDLSERVYVCDIAACSAVFDRDKNGALNLAALAP